MFYRIGKWMAAVLGLMLTVAILSGCSSGSSGSAATASGQSGTSSPCETTKSRRIVSVSPTATEMVFAIGAGSQVTAVDQFSSYPEQAPNDEGLSGINTNIEAVLGYNPDLVLVSSARTEDEFKKIEEAGICLLRLTAADDLDGVYVQLMRLGEVTGHTSQAAELVESMQMRTGETVEKAGAAAEPITYFYELDPNFYTVTDSTFVGYVLGLLGLVSIAPDEGNGYPQLNQEAILTANPDIIFLADADCCGQTIETVSGRDGWDVLKAVQQGNILTLDEDIASRWGPRIVDLMENVADFIKENFPE